MEQPHKVVRTERIEIHDESGRVRIIIGRMEPDHHDDGLFGVVVRSAGGRDRVWVLAEERTAEVGLDWRGNTVAALSVSDTGEPGLFLEE